MDNRKRKGTKYERIASKLFGFKSIELTDSEGKNPVSFKCCKLGKRKVCGFSKAQHDMDIHLISKDGVHLLGECKYYAKQKISKAPMAAFILIVEDIKKATGWDVRPVFVSHTEFQPGAKALADAYQVIMIDLSIQKIGKVIITESHQSYQYCDVVFHYAGGMKKTLREEVPHFLNEEGVPMTGIEVIRGNGTFSNKRGQKIYMFDKKGNAIFNGKFRYTLPSGVCYKKFHFDNAGGSNSRKKI